MTFTQLPREAVEPEPEVLDLLVDLAASVHASYIVETGTYLGNTAARLAEVAEVDTVEVDPVLAEEARLRCIGLPVTVHNLDTFEFTPRQPIDFLFVDAGMGDKRHLEIDHYRPFMADKGIAAVHDVEKNWVEFNHIEGWNWVHLPTERGLMIMRPT